MSIPRTALIFLSLSSAVACVAESEPRPDSSRTESHDVPSSTAEQIVTLTLETRAGTGEMGWSFEVDGLVPSDEADLSISSFDCGARGRWVQLVGPVELCFEDDNGELDPDYCTAGAVEIGGSHAAVALDERFWVVTDHDLHPVTLLDRTPTPTDWYEAEDLSFDVVLELQNAFDHGR